MEKQKITIVAHSGSFHTDDVFAVATLKLLLEEKNNIEVIRTRDKKIIDEADYVVDVGEMYDPVLRRFDHHQSDGAGARDNGIPYASFGLVWKEYGEEICGSKEVAQQIDQRLVQPIDAMDNGINFIKTDKEGLFMYDIRDITIVHRPTWSEGEEVLEESFEYLTGVFKKLLARQIFVLKDIKESEEAVSKIIADNKDKTLLILDKQYDYEGVTAINPYILLVVSPKRQDGTWSVKTVREDMRSYKARMDLPGEWAGKSGEELQKITGVPDAIFCHLQKFIAVAGSKEGAIKLAELALAQAGK
jgi:uncharacterized UPF0160 family protein